MDNFRYELECRFLELAYFREQAAVKGSPLKETLFKMKWFFKRIWRR